MLKTSAGSTARIHSMKACVLYETADGRVRHIHKVVTLVGGHEPSQRKMTDDAFAALRALPNAFSGPLEALHVAHDAIQPGVRYRVDTEKRVLVIDR